MKNTMINNSVSAEKTTQKKVLRGVVVSDKMQSTAIVEVQRFVKHPKYKKYMKLSKRFAVHNSGDKAKVGDKVVIRATRPLSKTKSFEIVF